MVPASLRARKAAASADVCRTSPRRRRSCTRLCFFAWPRLYFTTKAQRREENSKPLLAHHRPDIVHQANAHGLALNAQTVLFRHTARLQVLRSDQRDELPQA